MKTAIAIIVALIVFIGGYFLFFKTSKAPEIPATAAAVTNTTEAASATPAAADATTVTVAYDGASFSPATVTVKKGQSVTFVDNSSSGMWVASAVHPSHSVYSGTTKDQHCPDTSGTAFDQCATGTSFTFTFAKVGTWKYHNHVNASAFGTVVVTE